MSNTIHKHTAKQELNGIIVLKKDGNDSICPKTIAVLPVQNALQQSVAVQATQYPCNTRCPFAQIKERQKTEKTDTNSSVITDKKEYIYEIRCEGGLTEIILDEFIANKQRN